MTTTEKPKEKYLIIAVDQNGNEVGLESYAQNPSEPEITFTSKEQARTFYDVVKEDLSLYSVKMLKIQDT
ncbi:hypothetical protein SAMN05192534_10373 [Alteribacillus persepolensis]|uniref:Uncharacterized protein n=1 Tax=Alteribacillus persepolensis TaxID=568899 RepID=A0A1G8AYP6_9BACI|nr:hypothetical protein [Alteribacillus persepolensis]SDH26068.1 hypothetical protein SAMN05192534_10373 [Alteribacillus persepolensis]